MAVTDYNYYYYVTRDANGMKIGIVNDKGGAVEADLELVVYYSKFIGDLTLDDELPIPEGFKLSFIKGVVAEIADSYSTNNPIIDRKIITFQREYKDAFGKLNSRIKRQVQLPKVIPPLDMGYYD